jgi:hypothetical protein
VYGKGGNLTTAAWQADFDLIKHEGNVSSTNQNSNLPYFSRHTLVLHCSGTVEIGRKPDLLIMTSSRSGEVASTFITNHRA